VLECPRRAPVAQLDRASDFESAGRPFESGQARSLFFPIKTAEIRGDMGIGRLISFKLF
jgi:hypothetical protein